MKAVIYRIILTTFVLSQWYTSYASQNITIRGCLSENIKLNSVAFWFNDNMLDPTNPQPKTEKMEVKFIDRTFEVSFSSQRSSGYMVIGLGESGRGSYLIKSPYYFIYEDSDDIYVEIDSSQTGYHLKWSGKGAAKYELITGLNEHGKFKPNIENPLTSNLQDELTKDMIDCFNAIKTRINYIDSYKGEVSKQVRDMLVLDVTNYNLIYLYKSWIDFNGYSCLPKDKKVKLISEKLSIIDSMQKKLEANVTTLAFEKSVQLPLAKYYLTILATSLNDIHLLEVIKDIDLPVLRDRVLTMYFINQEKIVDPSSRELLFNTLRNIIEDEYCLKKLELYYNNSKIGKQVYNFSLPDVNGNIRTLSEFKGKVVFIDFWYTGCGSCGEYYRSVVKHVKDKFRHSKDIVFMTVSIDQNKDKWKAAISSGIYTSNEALNLHCPDGAREPIIQQFSVNTYPYPLLIDRSGNIFSNSSDELRAKGVEGLTYMIEKAIVNK